jgi:hypothetical protein
MIGKKPPMLITVALANRMGRIAWATYDKRRPLRGKEASGIDQLWWIRISNPPLRV